MGWTRKKNLSYLIFWPSLGTRQQYLKAIQGYWWQNVHTKLNCSVMKFGRQIEFLMKMSFTCPYDNILQTKKQRNVVILQHIHDLE